MIRINLLPEEYRTRTRTPFKLMLAVSGAVALNTSLLAWWAWTAFGVAAGIEGQRSVLQVEMDGLAPQVVHHKSLQAESAQYKTREATLAQIARSRISWTRKLDEFIDVVNSGGEGQRHLVWFDDFNVSQENDPRRGTFGSIKATGHSGSDQFAQVANFLQDLEESPFASDFEPPGSAEGSESILDEELMPSVVWAFPLSLEFKSLEERP